MLNKPTTHKQLIIW